MNGAPDKLPPWIAFDFAWLSIGWRVGPGETYWCEWQEWYESLSPTARAQYAARFAEPDGWQGFYRFIETGEIPTRFLEPEPGE